MIPELGQLALALAFTLSMIFGGRGLWQLQRGAPVGAIAPTLTAVTGLCFALVLLAFGALVASFLLNDFSVRNVAENSNTLLPMAYQFAATWGSHEGSLLLWVLMLAGWSAAVAALSRPLAVGFRARVLAVLLLSLSAFLLFLLWSSNPFERILPAPPQGRDLNPLLQDPVMVIHPPMLYMGYVGFAVSYAFAVAALLEGRLDATWARWSRPWANAAWGFLTIGILLGSWWAYLELGWGGWWFWDPVENASLMPWLVGTALIHSLAVTDKRDALKSWTVLLAITAFALSLLGTFLVRSGVLTSVHAFATDPKRGIFILVLLLAVVGSSYVLYAWRTRDVGLGGGFSGASREGLLLANNVLMSAALATVMLGTLYPLGVEVLSGRKMSVGAPYFEAVFAPILLPAVWLMALGPAARWKAMPWRELVRPLFLPLAMALAMTAAVIFLQGRFSVGMALGLMGAVGLAAATLEHALRQLGRLKAQGHSRALLDRVVQLGASYWGMVVAHLGVAVFVAGVTLVKTYELERDVVMRPGQTESLGASRLTFVGVDDVRGPNFVAAHGVFELTEGAGKVIYLLEPQKRRYLAGGQVMTEAAVDSGLLRDVYVSLGEPVKNGEDGAWSVRLYLKPCINWVWLGALMMALGAAITVFDRRYRKGRG